MNSDDWKIKSRKYLGNFKIFDIEKLKTISPRTGKELPFFLLNCQDWVNIIAITKENNIVMVKQHRFGTSKTELEIPGGIIEEGEEPMEAAKRELLEETGYEGNEFTYLGHVDPNPAFQTNKCHVTLIENCEWVSKQKLDPGEDIAVETVSQRNIRELIRDGTIRHSLVIAAFSLYNLN